MIIDIKRFVIFLFIVLAFIFYNIYSFFIKIENNLAFVILQNLKTNITELSYTLSKELRSNNDILKYRSLLDRTAANYDFIDFIIVLQDDKLILSTNPTFKELIKNSNISEKTDYYESLINKKFIEEEIRFYEGNNVKYLSLLYVLDKEELNIYFDKNKIDFFIYFGIIPLIIFTILLIILRYYILKPLEKLRQYAYYNNQVPKAFRFKELEAIRRSMVDSFLRLEEEKKDLYLMARTDSLSGLANRNSLNEYLERVIPISNRNNKEFAFLFLDIDHFKTVNDSLGHNIGDELLKNIASLIQSTLKPSDFVARVGGDEFVIILQEYNTYLELSTILNRIQEHLSKPWIIQTNPINISCSIGVSFYPKNGTDVISLMKNADIAMFEAKKLGRNQYHFFTEELNKTVQQTITLDKEMRLALKNNEYQLYYQAKIDLNNSEIIGVEALIRWISPKKGIISPSEFIPLAEENGFIIELGEWVVNQALKQYIKWKEKGIDIKISINVSAKQLSNIDFVKNLLTQIK